MVTFYLTRMERKTTQKERQDYLNKTVASMYRDQVREKWNEEHPDETLD